MKCRLYFFLCCRVKEIEAGAGRNKKNKNEEGTTSTKSSFVCTIQYLEDVTML